MSHEFFAFIYATLSVLFYIGWLIILFWFFGTPKPFIKIKTLMNRFKTVG